MNRAWKSLNYFKTNDGEGGGLEPSNNLSDLSNAASARENLGVYSKAAVDAKISDIAAGKGNVGTFHFGSAGGALQTTGNPMYGVLDQSHCMTLELDTPLNLTTVPALSLNFCGDNTSVSGVGYTGVGLTTFRGSSDGVVRLILRAANGTTAGGSFGSALFPQVFGGGNGEIPAGKYVMCVCIHFGDGTANDKSTAKIYINNALAYAYPETTTLTKDALIWSNTSSAKLGFFDTGTYHITNAFSKNGCFIGKASRFAVFNFDMSAAGAPYTVADYYNGKAIPVAMQSSLNVTWNETDVPIYSNMVTDIKSIPAGSVGYMSRLATIAYEDDGSISWTASQATSGFPWALVYRFKKAAIGSGKLKVKIGALTSTLPSGTKFFVGYCNASGAFLSENKKEMTTSGGTFEFDYKDGCVGMAIQIGLSTEWEIGNSLKVASVSVVVDGCVVASSDYAIARNSTTKLVKDITGNGNDLTVYGDVVGDKDAAVAAFVDELKTQISQNS